MRMYPFSMKNFSCSSVSSIIVCSTDAMFSMYSTYSYLVERRLIVVFNVLILDPVASGVPLFRSVVVGCWLLLLLLLCQGSKKPVHKYDTVIWRLS
jgi:hypothetical protein